MSDLSELYQQVILDHNRKPRNFRKLEQATRKGAAHTVCAKCGEAIRLTLERRRRFGAASSQPT